MHILGVFYRNRQNNKSVISQSQSFSFLKGIFPYNFLVKKILHNLVNYLFFCGIPRKNYNEIKAIVWARNRRILRITSVLTTVFGFALLVVDIVKQGHSFIPYTFLTIGSLIIYFFVMTLGRRLKNAYFSFAVCYGQMVLTIVYALLLSIQPSSYSIPATSVIIFIALLPITIDDRPIRMYGFMICECIGYLIFSYHFKDAKAFNLDLTNCISFTVIGIIMYSVVCFRNVKEISQGTRIEKMQNNLITTLATAVEERDACTGGHIVRTEQYVSQLVDKIRKKEKYSKLSRLYFRNVVMAAPMHDLGKIKIPDSILNKPGKLTSEEYEVMKKHAVYGADFIQKSMKNVDDDTYLSVAVNIAKYHHERYDGTGYPENLKGEQIPLEARIMALADVYDALVSKRPYKEAYSKEKAMEIIKEGIGTQFDPELAPIFLEIVQQG